MGLPAGLVRKRVENAESRRPQTNSKPCRRSRFLLHNRKRAAHKRRDFFFFSALGLEPHEQCHFSCVRHVVSFFQLKFSAPICLTSTRSSARSPLNRWLDALAAGGAQRGASVLREFFNDQVIRLAQEPFQFRWRERVLRFERNPV